MKNNAKIEANIMLIKLNVLKRLKDLNKLEIWWAWLLIWII